MSILNFRPKGAFQLICLVFTILVATTAGCSAQPARDSANAHIMDLSLQFDVDSAKVACLGDPNVIHVSRGDVVVFRARATNVDNVTWDPDSVAFNQGKQPLVARPQPTSSGPFARGRAYGIRINRGIPRSGQPIEYRIKVRCDGIGDEPPKIIVDP